jgi:putative transcriptional regulator
LTAHAAVDAIGDVLGTHHRHDRCAVGYLSRTNVSMKSLKGQLLVATPHLLDPNFARTVTLLFEHGATGAAGIILNRPTGRTIADVAEPLFGQPSDWAKPLHLGGPVPGPLMIVHGLEKLGDDQLMAGVYSTVDAKKIRRLVKTRPEPSLVVANYAGWGAGQLESEFTQDSWRLAEASPELIYWNEIRDLWTVVLSQISDQALHEALGLRERPIDPRLN